VKLYVSPGDHRTILNRFQKFSFADEILFITQFLGQVEDVYRPEIEGLLANGATQRFIAERYKTTEANLHH